MFSNPYNQENLIWDPNFLAYAGRLTVSLCKAHWAWGPVSPSLSSPLTSLGLDSRLWYACWILQIKSHRDSPTVARMQPFMIKLCCSCLLDNCLLTPQNILPLGTPDILFELGFLYAFPSCPIHIQMKAPTTFWY